jgi:uncharacterized protein (DUF1499 family)
MTLWLIPSVLIAILIAVGPLGALSGVLGPERGFGLFFLGVGLTLLSLPVFGGAAAFASATGKSWRGKAVRAAIVPLLVFLGLILPRLGKLNPPIHDVTTDPQDVLQFAPDVAAARVEGMERARVLELQRAAYPDLATLQLAVPPEQAFELALRTAREMPSWQVLSDDAGAGVIGAVATSRIFRFADDVVIRVQGDPAGSRVDVRSRSRFGQSDFGVNADRVRAYLNALRNATS